MTRHLSLVAVITLPLVLALGCGRDRPADDLSVVKLVSETRTDAMSLPSQDLAATVDTTTLWLGPDLARRDSGGGTFLVDAAGQLTQVDHVTHTWTSRSADEVGQLLAALAADTSSTDTPTAIDQLRSLLKVAARVSDTGEEAEIDGYRCRRWIVEQRYGPQHSTTELWLTRDIELDYGLLQRATRPAMQALPGGPAALAELSRLEGVPVRSSGLLRVMNRDGSTQSRLLSVETVTVPAAFFQPPADYRSADAPKASSPAND